MSGVLEPSGTTGSTTPRAAERLRRADFWTGRSRCSGTGRRVRCARTSRRSCPSRGPRSRRPSPRPPCRSRSGPTPRCSSADGRGSSKGEGQVIASAMRIGELAQQAGVTTTALRVYEQSGVLPEPARSPSGFRDYDETALARLRFIKGAGGSADTRRDRSGRRGPRCAGTSVRARRRAPRPARRRSRPSHRRVRLGPR